MNRHFDRAAEILLVEDNPGDIRLTLEALADGRIRTNVHVVTDGEQAMAFLRNRGENGNAVRPDLILLDLNLPKMSGSTVLAEIRADPALTQIPVIVLTTSSAQRDVAQAYQLHANCYITKPVDLEQFFRIVRLIEEFWLTVVQLPPGGAL